MNIDSYGEIINGEGTYKKITNNLKIGKSVIVGWTDGKYTHLDLLFNYNALKAGSLQRGLRGNELYVSIIGFGSFGFDVTRVDKIAGYIAEKLSIHGEPTVTKLAELINNIIKRLIGD